MRLAVAIATRGRPGILCEVLRDLNLQDRSPDRILVCHTSDDDIVGACEAAPHVELILSAPGSACQRNVLLHMAEDCDIVLFLDDDFLMAPNYISVVIDVMKDDAGIGVVTGNVVADGAKGPGLTLEFGRKRLLAEQYVSNDLSILPCFNGYGCNMGIRMSVVRDRDLEFDERLPLYAWYEDIDFTRRVGQHGKIVKLIGARGVHLGVKSGHASGRKLGYSQVANPVYLARKGSFPWANTIRSVSRNLAMNMVLSLWPEPFIDRRGRLWGNTRALIDLLNGSIAPERILDL